MIANLFAFLQHKYLESFTTLDDKIHIVLSRGQFLDSLDSEDHNLLIFALGKQFQHCFALLHVTKEKGIITQVKFLRNSDIGNDIPASFLHSLIPLLTKEKE
ncbi:MAG TPA: hypothetical protein VGD40_25110 [Chryseosolibacter sp.]